MTGAGRIALLGCGVWGRNLARNFHHLGALVAAYDPDPAALREVTDSYGCASLSPDEIFSDPSIEAVVIAAPAVDHYEMARLALQATKDVFVEKPLALAVSDAEELCRISTQNDRVLMVGHLMQYHPAFQELLALVREGALGKLISVQSSRLNFGRFRKEENILWSFAPHDISMILALLDDDPSEVWAFGQSFLRPDIADITTTHLQFPQGQRAQISVSWFHPFKEQKLVVVGEQGMALLDDGEDWPAKLRLFDHRVDWTSGTPQPVSAAPRNVPLEPAEPLLLECQHFLDCITSRSAPRTDGAEGLRVLRVLRRAEESLRQTPQ